MKTLQELDQRSRELALETVRRTNESVDNVLKLAEQAQSRFGYPKFETAILLLVVAARLGHLREGFSQALPRST